jgi:3-phenylpropionate/trans-cinnamate dioxygenase ferredoxin component
MIMSFVEIAKTDEIPSGQMKGIKKDDKNILVTNVAGKYYAIAGKCTHAGGDLSKGNLDGSIVTCPRHGSKFDVTTGKKVGGPAKQDVSSYPVKIQGNSILADIP